MQVIQDLEKELEDNISEVAREIGRTKNEFRNMLEIYGFNKEDIDDLFEEYGLND